MNLYLPVIGFIFGITMFAGLAHTFLHTPLEAITYDKAEKNLTETLVFREIALNIGRIIALLIVLFTTSYFTGFLSSGLLGIGYFFF